MARILLIDDDARRSALATDLLGARGHAVVRTAESGTPPELVLCGAGDPRAPGLRAAWPGAVLLLLAAPADAALRERLLDAGFDGYIGLPLEPDSFVDEVEAFLPAPPGLLLVDDDPFMLALLADTVQGQGWRVLTASSGEEALAVLARAPLAVLVSDHFMPGMRGADLLAEVRTRYPACYRILLSGEREDEAIAQALRCGDAQRFLAKPWDGATLLAALRAAFEAQARGV